MTPHDKNKSHLSSPKNSELLKIPKKQDNPKISKVTPDFEKAMLFLNTTINKATKPQNDSSSDFEDKITTSNKHPRPRGRRCTPVEEVESG